MLRCRADLAGVRGLAAAWAARAGLPPRRVSDVVIAVGELAVNTLAHNSGPGTLTLWGTGSEVICQVHDMGEMTDPLAGKLRACANAKDGYEFQQLARSSTDGSAGGRLILVAGRKRGVLVGAAAVGTGADDWISEASVAIRGQVPVRVLADVVHPYPTNAQACEIPLRQLP
jgi:hypothetical protein